MKKHNLFICACAIAIIGLAASCKNETVERENVSYKTYDDTYTVTGTISVVTNDYKCNSPSDIIQNDTTTESITVKSALASVSWAKSKTLSSNAKDYYVDLHEIKWSSTKKRKDKDGNETQLSGNSPSDEVVLHFILRKMGDKYYFYDPNNKEMCMDGFACPDLEAGKDFNLKFSYTTKLNYAGWVASDSEYAETQTKTTTYDLNFKAK